MFYCNILKLLWCEKEVAKLVKSNLPFSLS